MTARMARPGRLSAEFATPQTEAFNDLIGGKTISAPSHAATHYCIKVSVFGSRIDSLQLVGSSLASCDVKSQLRGIRPSVRAIPRQIGRSMSSTIGKNN